MRMMPGRKSSRGFGLIELMIALVLGLIVMGAVLALVASIMKANRQSIQVTRLTQELRATAAVIASDLKRARSVNDPLVTATATGGNPFNNIDYATAGCIRYGYFGTTADNFHVIRLTGGRVVRASGATSANATCTSTGVKLGSDQVAVTALTFTPTTPTTPTASTVRGFNMTITGNLIDDDPELSAANVSRSITQSVYIRSIGK